ncbi:Uncharacterised protein [uncultured archaeon]|nr:Uncharacterised protein [uncultured archaeon]
MVDDNLLDEPILGLIKTSDQDEIIYGVIIDASKEFREYLNPHTSPKINLQEKHKEFRPYELKDSESRAILFLSKIFLLKNPIRFDQIKVMNGKTFKPKDYRAAVFIDLNKSKLNPEEIFEERKEFESFSNNPFVQLLDYNKEDNLTNAFVFILKNNDDIKKEFLKLCGINKNSINFEMYLRKQLESVRTRKKSIPDITFSSQEHNGFRVLIEAKLFSRVDKEQLKKYRKYSNCEVICITRSGKKMDVNGVKFISWTDIYTCIKNLSESVPIRKQKKKLMADYFLGYLTNLGLSK